MARMEIEFEVETDSKGYRVLPARSGPTATEILTGASAKGPRPEYVGRSGGRLRKIRPLDRNPRLYSTFARLPPNGDAIAKFMSTFGPLTPWANSEGGSEVSVIVEQIKAMRSLIDAWTSDKAMDRAAFARMAAERIRIADLTVTLRYDDAAARFVISQAPKSLLDVLWLQFAQAAAKDTSLKLCKHCQTPFERGPGTGRRADAEFCSDDHRATFHSLARSRRPS